MAKELTIKVIFWLAVATWFVVLCMSGKPPDQSFFSPAPTVLGAVIAVVAIADRYAWRHIRVGGMLIARPDIQGTYLGELKSDWIDSATGEKIPPIRCSLSIYQTLSECHVRLYTVESASQSTCCILEQSPDKHWSMVYPYRNEPKIDIRDSSSIHYGTSRLDIETGTVVRLEGEYWTARGTKGTMEFRRISGIRVQSFKGAEDLAARTPLAS